MATTQIPIEPTDIQILTMTVITPLPNFDISFQALADRLHTQDKDDNLTTSDGYKVQCNFSKGKQFSNCIICKWTRDDGKKRCVKVFKNNLHMTGVKSYEEVLDIHKDFLGFMFTQDDFDNLKRVEQEEPRNAKTVMINSGFQLTQSVLIRINLDKLYALMKSDDEFVKAVSKIHYDINIHAALKVYVYSEKSAKDISFFIFASGKILVTGALTLDDIQVTRSKVMPWIQKFYESNDGFIFKLDEASSKGNESKKRGRKRKTDALSFYHSFDL